MLRLFRIRLNNSWSIVFVSSIVNLTLPVVMRVNIMWSIISVRSIAIHAPYVFMRVGKPLENGIW